MMKKTCQFCCCVSIVHDGVDGDEVYVIEEYDDVVKDLSYLCRSCFRATTKEWDHLNKVRRKVAGLD